MNKNNWKTLEKFINIHSPWVTLIGERLLDDRGKSLEYWRVERPDSAVIITLQNNQFLFPHPMYRPGIGERTLDFPGGRIPPGETPEAAILTILQRELGVSEDAIAHLTPLNTTGWPINSSFSNQKLYGFVAELYSTAAVNPEFIGATYPNTSASIQTLLKDLTCLQCRAILLEWQSQSTSD